jgi:hypothetical protein
VRTLAELCELIYPVPNPWDTFEQRERFEHHDLRHMSQPELLRERTKLELRLTLDDAPAAWLLERLGRLRRGG